MTSITPDQIQAISNIVAYNWADEQTDYNTAALEPGNSREGHVFRDLMAVQRWLESEFGVPHVEPHINGYPDDTQPAEPDTLREMRDRS